MSRGQLPVSYSPSRSTTRRTCTRVRQWRRREPAAEATAATAGGGAHRQWCGVLAEGLGLCSPSYLRWDGGRGPLQASLLGGRISRRLPPPAGGHPALLIGTPHAPITCAMQMECDGASKAEEENRRMASSHLRAHACRDVCTSLNTYRLPHQRRVTPSCTFGTCAGPLSTPGLQNPRSPQLELPGAVGAMERTCISVPPLQVHPHVWSPAPPRWGSPPTRRRPPAAAHPPLSPQGASQQPFLHHPLSAGGVPVWQAGHPQQDSRRNHEGEPLAEACASFIAHWPAPCTARAGLPTAVIFSSLPPLFPPAPVPASSSLRCSCAAAARPVPQRPLRAQGAGGGALPSRPGRRHLSAALPAVPRLRAEDQPARLQVALLWRAGEGEGRGRNSVLAWRHAERNPAIFVFCQGRHIDLSQDPNPARPPARPTPRPAPPQAAKQGPFPYARMLKWARARQLPGGGNFAVQDERTQCWVPLWYLVFEDDKSAAAGECVSERVNESLSTVFMQPADIHASHVHACMLGIHCPFPARDACPPASLPASHLSAMQRNSSACLGPPHPCPCRGGGAVRWG